MIKVSPRIGWMRLTEKAPINLAMVHGTGTYLLSWNVGLLLTGWLRFTCIYQFVSIKFA